MGRLLTVVLLLCASFAFAQTNEVSQSSAADQHSKKSKDEITVRGCVSKQNTDYLLMQPDQGNSYELQGKRFAAYLGQEVEVTGEESPTMASSSDYLTRSGAATSVTINVRTIKTVQKRCTSN